MNTIYDDEIRQQVLLERTKETIARDIAIITGIAIGAALAVVVAEFEKYGLSSSDKINKLSVWRIRTIRAKAMLAAKKRMASAVEDFHKTMKEVAVLSSDMETKLIKKYIAAEGTKEAKQASWLVLLPTTSMIWGMVKNRPTGATGGVMYADLVAYLNIGVKNAIEKPLLMAYSNGGTVEKLKKQVLGTAASRYANGTSEKAKREVGAIARTVAQHAAQQGKHAVWDANGVTQWRFIAVLDSRTTQTCRSLDGQVFPVGEGPYPPLHVNCRSTSAPIIRGQGAYRSGQTYYDWLQGQSDRFQDIALGKTRAKLFRDGGLTAEEFRRLNVNRDFEPLTLEEMRRLAPTAFEKAGV